MAGRQKLGEKFSVVLTEDLAALVEEAKRATGEETAPLLRKAIRAGLPLVKSGGAADVLTLDSELSKRADDEAKRAKRTRNSILIEAIRHGIEAVGIYEMIKEAKANEGLEEASEMAILASHELDIHPEKRAAKVAMLERAVYWQQVWDLVLHVPEAAERKDAIEKLIGHRIAAKEWKKVWGCGLRTSEIKWQVAMHEKYGHDSSQWPKAEFEKHKRESDAEDKANPKPTGSPRVEALPPSIVDALKVPEKRALLIEQARKVVGADVESKAQVSASGAVKTQTQETPAKKKPRK